MTANCITTQLAGIAKEAEILKKYADNLEKAAVSKDDRYKILVLDDNMKLWVSIGMTAKDKNSEMSEALKDNLFKLSRYVEQVTMSNGIKMSDSYFKSLAEINRQISVGLSESVNNNLAQQEAYCLAQGALDLVNAYKAKDENKFAAALDANQQLWVMIKTLMKQGRTKLPQETRDNLIKLADYVAANTVKIGKNIKNVDSESLDSILTINRYIAEGLIGHR